MALSPLASQPYFPDTWSCLCSVGGGGWGGELEMHVGWSCTQFLGEQMWPLGKRASTLRLGKERTQGAQRSPGRASLKGPCPQRLPVQVKGS